MVVVSSLLLCSKLKIEEEPTSNHNIVIVPHTIFKQWETSIKEHTNLKYLPFNNKKSIQIFRDIFNDVNEDGTFKSMKGHILLVSSTRISEFMNLNLKHWENGIHSRYFFDEADILKVPHFVHSIRASFVWFVSSSYKSLILPNSRNVWMNSNNEISQNYDYYAGFTIRKVIKGLKHTGYIKNIMLDLLKHENSFIKTIVLRNNPNFVRESFNLPEFLYHTIKCKTPFYLNVLNNSMSQEIISHINAGDLKGAMDKLDCKKYSEKDLIKAVTNELDIKLKNLKIEFDMKSQMVYSSEKAKHESLEKLMNKITSIQEKITDIKNKLDSQMCAICYDEVNNKTITPCCNTKYCFECISKWLSTNKTCPFCRASNDFNSLILVTEKESKQKDKKLEELLSKLENLKKIIESQMKKPKFKMLIFSEHSNSFTNMVDLLDSLNLKWSFVVGTSTSIEKKIRLFKDCEGPDKIDVLLLDAQYCANGINLENSTDIVIYHMMNKDRTAQIIGRGQRPGRTKPLDVWKLCYDNELD